MHPPQLCNRQQLDVNEVQGQVFGPFLKPNFEVLQVIKCSQLVGTAIVNLTFNIAHSLLKTSCSITYFLHLPSSRLFSTFETTRK